MIGYRPTHNAYLSTPTGLRNLFPPKACLVVPLALVWAASSAAPETSSSGGGDSTGSGSASSTGAGTAGSSEFYNDSSPVVTESSDYDSQAFEPSGGGSDNPFGFASAFAPNGCAPSGRTALDSRGSTAITLERPTGPRRIGNGRYIQASISGSETFSDNINLDSTNADSDFVTSVTPQFDACSSTGRIRGAASYQLQGVVYANNSDYNDVYNQFEGMTTINLIQRHLYLDANTRYGQTVIDPSVGYSRSNIIRPNDNKTSAFRVNISPYYVQSLGLLGQGMLRYRYGRSIYDDDSVPETTVQGVSGSISSPDRVKPISWRAQAVSQVAKRSDDNNQSEFYSRYQDIFGDDVFPDYSEANLNDKQHFDSATLQLGYQLSRTLKLTALGGIEDEYKENGENDRWSAPRYQGGINWNGTFNSLEANVGHRFYGTSYSLYAQHRTRLFDASLSYEEDPSSQGLEGLNNLGSGYSFGSVGAIGNMFGTGGYGGAYSETNSLLDRGVYVSKRWRARASFDTALTRTDITGYTQKKEYQEDSIPDSNSHGVEIDTRYALSPRMRLVPSARWEHQENSFISGALGEDDAALSRTNTDSDNYEAGVSLVRTIAPMAQAAVGYTRTWRDSSRGNDYEENRVTLQFRKGF